MIYLNQKEDSTKEFKRATAIKVLVKDLLNGEFIRKSGWESSYIDTGQGSAARVNVMGYIVLIQESNYVLDDGTGNISLRFFNEQKKDFEVGDLVHVIGRPRQFNNEIYIAIEIIKKVEPKWMAVRKVELNNKLTTRKKTVVEEKVGTASTNIYDKVIESIRVHDNGEGADFDEVVRNSKIPNCDGIIKNLLEEGIIYAPHKGRLKVLD